MFVTIKSDRLLQQPVRKEPQMRQGYFTTFRPDVKLPTLGSVLTAMNPRMVVSIYASTDEKPIVERTSAGNVTWQKIGRYVDCYVRAIESAGDVMLIGIEFGGTR